MIVVIGNAKLGLVFVGPFAAEADARAYIAQWIVANPANGSPIGAVALKAPTDLYAGHGLQG